MRPRQLLTALAITACATQWAHAQSASVENPGFEDQDLSTTDALRWREFNTARRRTLTDGLTPPAQVRTGNASMELRPGNVFIGLDTELFNSSTFLFSSPAYGYGCGPAVFRYWYNIPAANALQSQPGGLKIEFRRDNNSVYYGFEALNIRTVADGQTGHTDGQWVMNELVMWPSFLDFIHLYNNQGMTYGTFPGEAPTRASLLPFRFGGDWMTETGTMFIDDVEFIQDTTGSEFDEFIIFDDTEASARLANTGGVMEPAIPVFFYGDSTVYTDGDQLGFGCMPSADEFLAINIIDRVPTTDEYPQTFADIVANGYVRAVFQNADGTTGSFGSSVISGPSFRPQGQPLDLIPEMSQADFDFTYNFPMFGGEPPEPQEPPLRSDMAITGTGTYGSSATLVSTRDYSTDPVVDETTYTIDYTWTADQNINLETARATGNDAFRLLTISSMFANRAAGEYDGSFIEVQEAGGGTTQLVLTDSTPRAAHLFGAPVSTSVGKAFTLFQDEDATFNPDSPTVEVTIDSLTGVTGTIGVQGFLDSSTDPNDDSLTVWLEWVDAPATITSGTVIEGSFTVRILPPSAVPAPSCIGDLDNDGDTDVFDFNIFAPAFGSTGLPPFTGGDLDGDGDVDVFDFNIFAPDFGCGS